MNTEKHRIARKRKKVIFN